MTVAALPSVVSYVEDGATVAFPVPYRFDLAGLIVERLFDGEAMPLSIGVDYTVSGGETDAGGTLTRTVATNGAILRVRRQTPLAQPMVYTTGDRFPADSHEAALDRQTMVSQDIARDASEGLDRAVQFPIGESAPSLPVAADRRDTVVAFDPLTGGMIVKPIGSFPPGPPGGAGNVVKSIGQLRTTPVSEGTMVAAYDGTGSAMTWTEGNFASLASQRPTDYVESDFVPLTGGAWVRQGAEGTIFSQGSGAAVRDLRAKLRETKSVLDFYLPTDPDMTSAFNRGVATGYALLVPPLPGGYPVRNIAVVKDMQIIGAKAGEALGPELVAYETDSAIFRQAPAAEKVVPHLYFENLVLRAAPGVTGVTGFRGSDKTDYSGYCTFQNIETHRTLLWSYDSLFIFADWINCRDGYLPGNGDFTMPHGFIRSEAATYGQPNASNTCNVIRPKVFGCVGVDAAIQLAYGDDWNITDGRWENMYVPAVRARSVSGLRLFRNRSEGFHTTEWATLQEMPGSGVGSTADIQDNLFYIDVPNFRFAVTDALSRVGFARCGWSILAAGAQLCNNALALTYNREHRTISGLGAGGFMTGMRHDRREAGQTLLNGAASNGNMQLTQVNDGGTAATKGFASGLPPVEVGTNWVTIFDPAASVGMVCVAGYQTSGAGGGVGTQHFWPVGFTIGDAALFGTAITPGNGVVAEFRRQAGGLQMRCTTGTAIVTVSAMVA